MKKTIYLLLILLLVLIVTCVYQKTYTLYEKVYVHDTNASITTQKMPAKQEVTPPKEKEILKNDTKSEHRSTTIQIETKKEDRPQKSQNLVNTSMESNVSKNSALKEPTFLEKVEEKVISVVSLEDKVVHKKSEGLSKPKGFPVRAIPKNNKISLDTEIAEKEVVDYLLTVLKEQEIALSNRDEAESKLEALIKKVLEERSISIKSRQKASLDIDKKHEERLQKREQTAQDIYKKYQEEKGK